MSNTDIKNGTSHIQGMSGRVQNFISGFVKGALVAIILLFQFVILLVLPFVLRQYFLIFFLCMEIFGIITIIALTNDNRSMAYKFAWLCIVVVIPISGNLMFLLWGQVGKRNKLNRKIAGQIKQVDKNLEFDSSVLGEFMLAHPVTSRMSTYIQESGSPLYKNNEVKYYQFGQDAFEDIFVDLEKAKRFIFIEFFIVAEGGLWDDLHRILKKKVEQGVEVKFLFDDFGALLRTNKNFVSDLRNEGIQVEVFNPIQKYTSKLFMNFRDHQKIIVIDGNVAYTGGFNIADEYANLVERFGVWKDAGVRLTGDAVWGMTITFLELFTVCSKEEIKDFNIYRGDANQVKNSIYCHVLRDGPALNPRSFVASVYKQMIQYAGRKLYVMTPYLILEDFMIDTFIEAAARGVDVRIITPFIPDKKNTKQITEYNYGILLKNGIRIFEYTPGFIHSKVVMNEHSAIVGTINMDYRSFYLHYENGLWVYDKEFLKEVEKDFTDTFSQCNEITYNDWLNRPLKKKMIQKILNVFDTLV